jgi:CRISPR-associated protein Csd1
MILISLVKHYERLAAQGKVPPFGMTQEKIGFSIVLDANGVVVDVDNLRDVTDKKSRWKMLAVPASFKRSGTIPKPFFLWDKAAHVLGVEQKPGAEGPALTPRHHAAFKTLHLARLADATDEGLVALRKYIEGWDPSKWEECEHVRKHAPEILSANLVFRLDQQRAYIHESAAASSLVVQFSDSDDSDVGTCLVTGQKLPIARLHPSIKNVFAAQPSGASIVSFNQDAFDSYGKKSGANAPVSTYSAFAYGTALNYLLRTDVLPRHRVVIGDTTTVFWAEAPTEQQQTAAEDLFAEGISPSHASEASKLMDALARVANGQAWENLDPKLYPGTKMFVLGLAPSNSRLSVRFWFTENLTEFARRLREHYLDLEIEPSTIKTPSATLLIEGITGKGKKANFSPLLAGALMRAILTGGRYPGTLLSATIIRMRADHQITKLRVAMCKGILARNQRLDNQEGQQEIPMGLNIENAVPSYLLGRLFAVYEKLQILAIGPINASIMDRFYNGASTHPARIFSVLIPLANTHMSKSRKDPDKAQNAALLDKDIEQVMCGLNDELPARFTQEDQGRFALGYYHQRHQFPIIKAARADIATSSNSQSRES